MPRWVQTAGNSTRHVQQGLSASGRSRPTCDYMEAAWQMLGAAPRCEAMGQPSETACSWVPPQPAVWG